MSDVNEPSESASDKNTDAEIRDGVWDDGQKASAADVGNTATDKNSAAEIRDGVWDDGQKASAADVGNTATDKNTAGEIRNAVWSDNQQHGPSDLKAAAVDFRSLTPKAAVGNIASGGTLVSVTGSGIIFGVGGSRSDDWSDYELKIDGTTVFNGITAVLNAQGTAVGPLPFSASFEVINRQSNNMGMICTYGLD